MNRNREDIEGGQKISKGQASLNDIRIPTWKLRRLLSGGIVPRSPRADEAGGLYHALNRANLRATIFHNEEDYVASKRYFLRTWRFIR